MGGNILVVSLGCALFSQMKTKMSSACAYLWTLLNLGGVKACCE